MRIVFAGNLRVRDFGAIGLNTDRKLLSGLIKAGHAVFEFSDRDVAHLDTPLGLKALGARLANRRFLELCENVAPDLVILGHADILRNETIAALRTRPNRPRIAHWNLDALFFAPTADKIRARAQVCDALFLTTAGAPLKAMAAPGRIAAFVPNLTDAAAEPHDNSLKDAAALPHDLLYFGVGNPSDPRWALVGGLMESLKDIQFSVYGSHGRPKLLGLARDAALGQTKMALNLNRIEGDPLYSSDRIALLQPNGIVAFLHARSGLQRFFTPEEAVFFETADDIAAAARAMRADDARRRAVAAAGRTKYRALFDSARVGAYIVETTLDLPASSDYEWADEIYRG